MQVIDVGLWITIGWLVRGLWEDRKRERLARHYSEVERLRRLQAEGANPEELLAAMSPALRQAFEAFKQEQEGSSKEKGSFKEKG